MTSQCRKLNNNILIQKQFQSIQDTLTIIEEVIARNTVIITTIKINITIETIIMTEETITIKEGKDLNRDIANEIAKIIEEEVDHRYNSY